MSNKERVKNPGIVEAIARSGKDGKNGSLEKLARKAEVSFGAVSRWMYVNCPAERAIQVEQLTGVHRSRIRPDLFNTPEDGEGKLQ